MPRIANDYALCMIWSIHVKNKSNHICAGDIKQFCNNVDAIAAKIGHRNFSEIEIHLY